MKKVLAIILTVVMLFGVIAINTSADEATPKVTIVTNKGSAVAKDVTTYFTVRFDNFSSIKGIDVTVTADQYIELGEVSVSGFDIDKATPGVNYTKENDGDKLTIRFVDLTGTKDGKIIFAAKVPGTKTPKEDPTITVTGKFADSGKTLFEDIVLPATGTFELTKEIATEETKEATTITAPNGKFIPAGGVFTGEGDNVEFVDKKANGTFDAPKGATYQTYDIPEHITTFGAQDDPKDSTKIRFGNYSKLNTTAKEHGTLVFEGDWLVLKNYYIQRGYTVQQFVKALYNDVTKKLAENPGASYVYYKVGGKQINVYRFKQTRYMWQSGDVLEYAIRLDGIQPGFTYTAVAYSIAKSDDAVTISDDVKSVTRPAA